MALDSTNDSKKKDEHKPAKVDKWDASATKNALDDAVKLRMTDKYNCEEDFTYMDRRLLLSLVGVAFSAFACAWDFYQPFPQSFLVLRVCSVSYFIVMGILTLYIMFVEGSIFYVGLQKDKAGVDPPNVWRFTSQQKKYDDIYELTVQYTDGSDKRSAAREQVFKESVTSFFAESGTLREDLFFIKLEQWCRSMTNQKKKQ